MTPPRRTHPLSPLVQAVPAFPVAFALLIGPGRDLVVRQGVSVIALTVLGAIVGYVAFAGVAWIAWRRRTFWIDADGDLRVDSGLFQRSSRRLQLSRLQGVDVVAPIVARIFGLVEVRVEVAGARDSRVVLRYLTRPDADALQQQLLGQARGADPAADAVIATPLATPLAAVPTGRLLAGLLMRSVTAALLLLTVALLVITALTQGTAGLLLAVITGGLPVLSVVSEFLANYGFRVDRSEDGLRIRRGLLSTQTRSIPPDRVHAVSLISPLLWRRWSPTGAAAPNRRADWVRVTVTIAGVDAGAERGPDVLIPVAPREEALALIAEILPGVDIDLIPFEPAPARARWRSPLAWRALAIAVTPQVMASRSGRITRRISVAPHARIQSVRITQGPWERRLGLASLHGDVAPGPIDVAGRHLAEDVVRPLADEETARMQRARRTG